MDSAVGLVLVLPYCAVKVSCGVRAPRSIRTPSESPLSGEDELRSGHHAARLECEHGSGARQRNNFFDTANVYGWGENRGLTERIVGGWFSLGGVRRELTVLATKLYGDMGDRPNDGKLSALSIRRACDASLARLQTDYIDRYQMHHVDRGTSWDEIREAMDVLRQPGKIIYVGSSNFAGWHIAQGQEAANRRGQFGLVVEQSIYNLVERSFELEVLPAAQFYGLGVIPWSPLHGGLLGGILRKEASGGLGRSSSGRVHDSLEQHRPAIEAWEAFCDDRGEALGDVTLVWLLHPPAVTAPRVGPRTSDQLDGALRALEISFD
jgi:aryl-alcohol dehydrogenase-like predicted oxidoreductase